MEDDKIIITLDISPEVNDVEFFKINEEFENKFYSVFGFYPEPDPWELNNWTIPKEELDKLKEELEK